MRPAVCQRTELERYLTCHGSAAYKEVVAAVQEILQPKP